MEKKLKKNIYMYAYSDYTSIKNFIIDSQKKIGT